MFTKHAKLLVCALCAALLVAAGTAWVIGCAASVTPAPGGGVNLSFTIAGTTFSFTLGPAGLFAAQPNTMVRNVADLTPFQQPPSDTPATGALRMRSSSVTVLPPGGASKWQVHAQSSLNGTARVRVAIDAPGAPSPCETGVDLGQFEIVVENGIVTSTGPDLPLVLAAADYFTKNNLSLCLELTSDFEADIEIAGLDVTFGPAQSNPGEGIRATFERRNLASPPIHLMAPGEGFTDENRTFIGVPSTMTIDGLSINGLVTFQAGRDGQVLDSATCPPVRYGGYYAVVEWDGNDLRCYEPVFAPEAIEACCMPPLAGYELYLDFTGRELLCQNIGSRRSFRTREDCRFFGGVPQGAGTDCASITCDEPFAACCFGNSCTEMLFEDCQALGGVFQGSGSRCDSLTCDEDEPPTPPGPPTLDEQACCLPDGSCDVGDVVACEFAGGTAQGRGSTCATVSCPQPPGACCATDETCTELTEEQCRAAGGAFQGGGTDCATADCDLGACCWGGDQCTDTSADICAELDGGRFQGTDTSCDANACAEGACCWSGGCTLTSPADCTELGGAYQGDDTACDPDPCTEFVVWYTGNVCCWGAPLVYISERAELERAASTCNYPGGGIDCTVPLVRVELMGGFETEDEASAWVCPRFVSQSYHYWCGAHYQMDGQNWQPTGSLGCDLSGLPNPAVYPEVNGCE